MFFSLYIFFSFLCHFPFKFFLRRCISMQNLISMYGAVMSIFTKRSRPANFAYQWLDNVKINKYAQFDQNMPCGSRVVSRREMMLSKPLSIKKGCYTGKRLDTVDMHLYAKFDQNIPCCSRVMSSTTK